MHRTAHTTKSHLAQNLRSFEVEKLCRMHPTIPHVFKCLEDGHWSLEDTFSKCLLKVFHVEIQRRYPLRNSSEIFFFPILPPFCLPLPSPPHFLMSVGKMKLYSRRECLKSKAWLFLVTNLIVAMSFFWTIPSEDKYVYAANAALSWLGKPFGDGHWR